MGDRCGLGDHPRSRGVYAPHSSGRLAGSGSSPLARGLPRVEGDLGDVVGIIPARAGFTWGTGSPTWGTGDHPRSRGVYQHAAGRGQKGPGSSPLARGLRDA